MPYTQQIYLVDPNTNYVHNEDRITIIDTVWIPSYLINQYIYIYKKAFDVVIKL